jgi:hypothetical protein
MKRVPSPRAAAVAAAALAAVAVPAVAVVDLRVANRAGRPELNENENGQAGWPARFVFCS